MENETKEPTLSDLMAKFEEMSTRLTALETPPAEAETDKKDEPEPVATDPDKEPAKSDPEKTYENPDADKDDEATKKAELQAERIADKFVKKFMATMGATKLGKPGTGGEPVKEKHFEEHVADLAVKEFSGDQNKARVAILTNKEKHPDAWKAYVANRNVKTA